MSKKFKIKINNNKNKNNVVVKKTHLLCFLNFHLLVLSSCSAS